MTSAAVSALMPTPSAPPVLSLQPGGGEADALPLLQAGYAVEVGGEHRRVELFTNRQGRFAAAGLRPGQWRIEIAGTPPLIYDLFIPETAKGVLRVGELMPKDER